MKNNDYREGSAHCIDWKVRPQIKQGQLSLDKVSSVQEPGLNWLMGCLDTVTYTAHSSFALTKPARNESNVPKQSSKVNLIQEACAK